jgi:aldehyde:ferredoxin oxidoreductase
MNQYTEEHQGDTSLESQIYSAVTGLDTSEEEMYEMGERIFNLERALMVREGRRREQDHLAPEFAVPTSQPIWYGNYEDGPTEEDNMSVDPVYFNNQLLDSWYQLLGWTSAGIPTRARLKELGVEDIADKLKL